MAVVKTIYLATEKNQTVGIAYNSEAQTAEQFAMVHDSVVTRRSTLEAIVAEVTRINPEEETTVVNFHVNGSVANAITSGRYKEYILTGVLGTGKEVDADELELWKVFHDVMCSDKGLYVNFINSSAKKKAYELNGARTQQDECDRVYMGICWEEVKKAVKTDMNNSVPSIVNRA